MNEPSNEWDVKSYDWELTPESVVVEVGGFNGRWAAGIARLRPKIVHVFEPQAWAVAGMVEALDGLPIAVYPYGLGTVTGTFDMGAWGTDSCSFLRDREYMESYVGSQDESGRGAMIEARTAFELAGIESVDLLLMNIEGYEYPLLRHMHEQGMLARIRWLMVQFHSWNEAPGEYEQTRELLGETHDVLWDYGRTLAAWELRP